MPNKPQRNKRGVARLPPRGGPQTPKRADSVKDVLARLSPTLTRVTDQAARQSAWRQWLDAHLPAQIVPRVSGVVEREGTLVIFAESAAWSARLRYAVQEIETQLRKSHPAIAQITVRVLPRG